MELRLDNKTALVTGGSRGIGKAIATSFAQAGANVMITSRKAEACEVAAAEIGHGCRWTASNVGEPDGAARVVQETIDAFGAVDVLVNNAATNPYAGPMIDVDLPRWQKTLDVNLTAPLVWTQEVWQRSMKAGGGVVINISSVGGLSTNPILGVYDVTKAALIHATKQLAAEMGPAVRVNAICPGLIKTDFARALWDDGRGDEVAQAYPLKRLGEVEDIAGAALYLAAETGSWITGQTIVLDGGGLISFR
ncbi:MAG: SDR family oxidoreductase [Acidimicrobiales bacterium]|nr:SDR family oxidoreductase [Acidimicrobiales bacterium]